MNHDDIIYGKGIGTATGISADGTVWPVHNIYLVALGEYGILGLFIYPVIFSIIFFKNLQNKSDRIIKIYLYLFMMIGFLQPALLLTQISTSLIFWILFSKITFNEK